MPTSFYVFDVGKNQMVSAQKLMMNQFVPFQSIVSNMYSGYRF